MITTVKHPRSGETYAVEVYDEDGTITRAAPIDYAVPRDEESLRDFLDNQDLQDTLR